MAKHTIDSHKRVKSNYDNLRFRFNKRKLEEIKEEEDEVEDLSETEEPDSVD